MKESFFEAAFNLEFGDLSQPATTSIEFYFYFHLDFVFLSFCVRAKLTFDGEIIHILLRQIQRYKVNILIFFLPDGLFNRWGPPYWA